MIGLPENEPATSLSRPDAVSGPKNQTPGTPKVEDSVVEVGGELSAAEREAAERVIDTWQIWLNAPSRTNAEAQAQSDMTVALVQLDALLGRMAANQDDPEVKERLRAVRAATPDKSGGSE